MTTSKDIPYMLRLLEDDSPVVRAGVVEGFLSFGPHLEAALDDLPRPLDSTQRRTLDRLLAEHFCEGIRKAWPEWLEHPSNNRKLERGYELIAEFQDGLADTGQLTERLDALAAECAQVGDEISPSLLMEFLFHTKAYRGARKDYHDPCNSNLSYVLEKKCGIPISLACLAILVGDRLGLEVHGCNFPGHFLARYGDGAETIYVDCFNGGRCYREAELSSRFSDESDGLDARALMPASTEAIVARVLRNLVYTYGNVGDRRRLAVSRALLLELERIPASMSRPLFEPGQLVQHKHYAYHGVITATDSVCRASEEWYGSNRSQPDRNQPWYHVLVDGSDACTYAAQENLESDPEGLPIQHPLLEQFFIGFQEGRYIRNDRPWTSD
jgi:hemimethylated DNA binding protein